MENQQNPTDSRKTALTPKQTLGLPYIAATASLSAGQGPPAYTAPPSTSG